MMLSRLLPFVLAVSAYAGDWLTYAHDPQRTGWAFEETKLTPENVGKLGLAWKTKLKNEPYSLSALTPPVVAAGISTAKGVRAVVYTAGITGTVFALDAETGEELWTREFKYSVQPGKARYQGTFLCPNGITATPVIDRTTNLLYVIAGNGALYGLDLGSGTIRYGPVQFVAPFSKNWSLSIVDGVLYTTLAQGCGGGLSGFYSVDLKDRHHPVIQQMLLSNTDTAGIWGRGGPIIGTNGRIYGGTADGVFDPVAGDYSNTEIAVSAKDLKLLDYYLPLNWQYIRRKDFDLGSASPVFFGWKNRNLLAAGAKEGILYLLDADNLGGSDHQTTRLHQPAPRQRSAGVLLRVRHLGRYFDHARSRRPDLAHRSDGRPARRRRSQVPHHQRRDAARQSDGGESCARREGKSDHRARLGLGRFRYARPSRDRQWRRVRHRYGFERSAARRRTGPRAEEPSRGAESVSTSRPARSFSTAATRSNHGCISADSRSPMAACSRSITIRTSTRSP